MRIICDLLLGAKKWHGCWAEVRYCSERCKRESRRL
ncbi:MULTISPECIES: DUF2256 domain-containing protein [Acinetobacter]|nr:MULTISPECIES: DUF2256 domain-containing protein [Acinetobacter]HRM16478.1 DUF2256 domain-containing protein [Acinetobacter parvus]